MTYKENSTADTAGSKENTFGMNKIITRDDPESSLSVKFVSSDEGTTPSPESCLRVAPLEINLGTSLTPLVDPSKGGNLLDRIHRLRNVIASEIEFVFPMVRVCDTLPIDVTCYRIKIAGETVATWLIHPDRYMAIDSVNTTGKIEGIEAIEPAFGTPALWIDESVKEQAKCYGYTVVEPSAVIATHLLETIRKHADEILTVDMTQYLFDNLRKTSPVVVDEVLRYLTIGQIHQVLQYLLREQIPIRQLETILGALLAYGSQTKDLITLTTYVRMKLARTICARYRNENNVLNVVMLDPALEDQIRAGFEHKVNGLFLKMSLQAQENLCRMILAEVDKLTSKNYPPIVLVNPQIRMALRLITHATIPGLVVLSLAEITQDTQVVCFGMVGIETKENDKTTEPQS